MDARMTFFEVRTPRQALDPAKACAPLLGGHALQYAGTAWHQPSRRGAFTRDWASGQGVSGAFAQFPDLDKRVLLRSCCTFEIALLHT